MGLLVWALNLGALMYIVKTHESGRGPYQGPMVGFITENLAFGAFSFRGFAV